MMDTGFMNVNECISKFEQSPNFYVIQFEDTTGFESRHEDDCESVPPKKKEEGTS